MKINEKNLDQFLDTSEERVFELDEVDNDPTKKLVENDGLIERTTLIEKKLIVEDGRQLLVEERPITHSEYAI